VKGWGETGGIGPDEVVRHKSRDKDELVDGSGSG
jgi:hypothetical protein